MELFPVCDSLVLSRHISLIRNGSQLIRFNGDNRGVWVARVNHNINFHGDSNRWESVKKNPFKFGSHHARFEVSVKIIGPSSPLPLFTSAPSLSRIWTSSSSPVKIADSSIDAHIRPFWGALTSAPATSRIWTTPSRRPDPFMKSIADCNAVCSLHRRIEALTLQPALRRVFTSSVFRPRIADWSAVSWSESAFGSLLTSTRYNKSNWTALRFPHPAAIPPRDNHPAIQCPTIGPVI